MADKDFCTILDKLGKEKKYADFAHLAIKLCITSILSGRRLITLCIPSDSYLKKIEKMSDKDAIEAVRRHIIQRAYSPDYFKEKMDGKSVKSHNGYVYNVKIGGSKIIIDGHELKHLTKASNGEIYVIDSEFTSTERQPISASSSAKKPAKASVAGVARAMKIHKRMRSKSPMRGGCIGMRGGGVPELVASLQHLYGKDLRVALTLKYKDAWPTDKYPCGSYYCHSHWLASNLVLFLKDEITDFTDIYAPLLHLEPQVTVELLLQPRVNTNNYFVNDSLIQSFTKSKYCMMFEPDILELARQYILFSGGSIRGTPQHLIKSLGKRQVSGGSYTGARGGGFLESLFNYLSGSDEDITVPIYMDKSKILYL
jgi:hypothetical protein